MSEVDGTLIKDNEEVHMEETTDIPAVCETEEKPKVQPDIDTIITIGTTGNNDDLCTSQREEFTSEAFKIEIKNLPKHISHNQIKKMLQSLNIAARKIKHTPRSNFAFIALRSEEEQEKAIEALVGHIWKKSTLFAKKARPKSDPVLRKRKHEENNDDVNGKKGKQDEATSNLTPVERVANAVAPLHAMSYIEQIKMKEEKMQTILRNVGHQLSTVSSGSWVRDNINANSGMCCPLLPIKESPIKDFYRNKVEFNVGPHPSSEGSAVGFRLGNYREGNCFVAEPSECRNVTSSAKALAKHFQDFISRSKYPGFDPVSHSGLWKMLTVRTTTTEEIMVIVQIYMHDLSNEAIDEIKNEIKLLFTTDECPVKVTSVYLEIHQPSSSQQVVSEMPLHHITGEEGIHEKLFGMNFRISPRAFFQVNTGAAEVLYSTIKEMCNPTDQTIILDVCCGTGTIGLYLAKTGVKHMYGIELCQPAIDDAKFNAVENGITNSTFICSKAEDAMADLTKRLSQENNIIAIVDPPRAGLHTRVVQALRRCNKITQIVYVSCNPKAASTNFIDLCRIPTKRVKGCPFQMIRSIPVDLFPHTEHCELVSLFTRSSNY